MFFSSSFFEFSFFLFLFLGNSCVTDNGKQHKKRELRSIDRLPVLSPSFTFFQDQYFTVRSRTGGGGGRREGGGLRVLPNLPPYHNAGGDQQQNKPIRGGDHDSAVPPLKALRASVRDERQRAQYGRDTLPCPVFCRRGCLFHEELWYCYNVVVRKISDRESFFFFGRWSGVFVLPSLWLLDLPPPSPSPATTRRFVSGLLVVYFVH